MKVVICWDETGVLDGAGFETRFPQYTTGCSLDFFNHAEKLPDYLTSEMKGRVQSTQRRSITQPEVSGKAP